MLLDWSQQFIQESKLEGRRAAKTEQRVCVCVVVFLCLWGTQPVLFVQALLFLVYSFVPLWGPTILDPTLLSLTMN